MGANIKVGAESKQFQEEMKRVTQDLKLMASELRVATTQATLFGTEQERLGAKSAELSGKLTSQTRLLEVQRQAMTSLTGDIGKYRERNVELARSIADVEARLQAEIRLNGEGTTQARNMQRELQGLQREHTANATAIGRSESQLTNYNIRLNDTQRELIETERELQNTERDLRNINWVQAGERMEAFGNKAKAVGQTMTMALTVPLTAMGAVATKNAISMEDEMSKVDVVFKTNANEIKKWSGTVNEQFGISGLTALQMSSNFGAMAVGMGLSSNKSTEMSKKLTELAGDLSSFSGVRLDVAQTALNSIFTGETESLKKMGIVMTQVNLQNYENVKGNGKKIESMNESEKTMLRYNFILEKTSLSQGDFERTGDSGANITRKFTETLKDLSASFGKDLLPAIKPVLVELTKILKWIIDLSPATKIVILMIGGLISIIGPLLMAIGQASIGFAWMSGAMATMGASATGATGAVGGLGIAMGVLTSPITFVVLIIAGIGLAIWALWDDIVKICKLAPSAVKGAVEEVGQMFVNLGNALKSIAKSIVDVFKSIGKAIMVPVNFVVDGITKAVNTIKDLFKSIKLPSFKIPSMNFGGSGTSFFADGGIMTKATVFGMNGNNKMIGGEAGQEAILPLSQLWDNMDKNFNNLERRLSNKSETTIINNQEDSNKVKDGDTYIFKVDMSEIDDVIKLKNILNNAKQNKRQFT